MFSFPYLPDDVHHQIILALAQPTRPLAMKDEFDFEDSRRVNTYLYSVAQVSKLWSVSAPLKLLLFQFSTRSHTPLLLPSAFQDFALPLLWTHTVVGIDQLRLLLLHNGENPRVDKIALLVVVRSFWHSLSSAWFSWRDYHGKGPWPFFQHLSNLQVLSVESPFQIVPPIPQAVLPKLRSLETTFPVEPTYLASFLHLQSLTSLTSHTRCESNARNTAVDLLQDPLHPFLNLTTLRFFPPGNEEDLHVLLAKVLPSLGPQLRHFGLFVDENGLYDEPFPLPRICPDLEILECNHIVMLSKLIPVESSVLANLHTLVLGNPDITSGNPPSTPSLLAYDYEREPSEIVDEGVLLVRGLVEDRQESDLPSLRQVVLRHYLFGKEHRARMDPRLVGYIEKMREKGWKKVVDHFGEEWVEGERDASG